MGKPGTLGLLMGRRKSAGNAMDAAESRVTPEATPVADSGGFRVMTQTEVQKVKQEQAKKKDQEKKSSFPRFSGFGGTGNKARHQSHDEDSLSSSKRDSKSSSGTQFSSSRPYHAGHYGSTSTLPSSADTDPNDNMFAALPPRPHVAQHNSSPNSMSVSAMRRQLSSLPQAKTTGSSPYDEPTSPSTDNGRTRAMTTSSYASTAIPPKIDADLAFGSGFDDMFSGLDRKHSPDFIKESPGRSLLAGKRAFQAEPIRIDRKSEIEPSPASWDSRGSDDNLMSPRFQENNSPPPPVPPHRYAQYAPVASHSPELLGSGESEDVDAKQVRQSFVARRSINEKPPPHNPNSLSSSSATSFQTPLSSRSASNNTTPTAALRVLVSHDSDDDEDDNMFAPSKAKEPLVQKPAAPTLKENSRPPAGQPGEPAQRVMTAAEFKAHQASKMAHPPEDSSDEEDYEDEEEAIQKREQEMLARRKLQQQQLARQAIQRSTTSGDPNRPDSVAGSSMGFPSETSLRADEWTDEDVPLGILAAHGFPSSTRVPNQPANAAPSYFRSSTPSLPERPASAGTTGNRASHAYRPPFARNLPDDPYSSVIGGGLVRPTIRESMGFNRGPASVHGDSTGMSLPMIAYPEPQQQPSLVERIHMSEMSKKKYNGGASSKQPQQGPFTGSLGHQMNGMNQAQNPTRMSQMPMLGMPGMQGMNGGNPMMMMGGQMPMMGMNQMAFPVQSQNELMQMQFLQFQQMQFQQQQAQMYGQQPQLQNPHMPMNPGFQAPNFGTGSFLSVPNGAQNQQRPMSIMSFGGQQGQPPRPYSTPSRIGAPQNGFQVQGLMPASNGYTPSIAPSERSNIGLSARYRPVVTGNQDAVSSVSSMTLQASGGAAQNTTKVKGILKNKGSPQVPVREDDEEDWGKMAARKNKKKVSFELTPRDAPFVDRDAAITRENHRRYMERGAAARRH